MTTIRSRSGFTLVEVLIVVVILGVLATICIASFGNSTSDSADKSFVSNLRTFSTQFSVYEVRNGIWPAERAAGVVPPELASTLDYDRWTNPTPIGGNWDWDFNLFGVTAGISVVAPDRTSAQMTEIDRLIDDGNLNTGSFRERAGGGAYIFVLVP